MEAFASCCTSTPRGSMTPQNAIVQLPALPSVLVASATPRSTIPPLPSRPSPAGDADLSPPTTQTGAAATVPSKRAASSSLKGKKKAKNGARAEKRFGWSNAMIVDLLEMRFNDEEVKRRIESADTSMKKRLASQYFATRLSEKLNVVLSGTQVSTKYKKLKCEYRQGKSARSDTGNIGREDDSELWVILNSFFVGRPGIAGAVLADAEEEEDYPDNDVVFNSSVGKSKTVTPLTHLADAMKEGMTALAASMSSDEKLATAIQEMKNAQLATQQLQAKQLTLLELLLNKFG